TMAETYLSYIELILKDLVTPKLNEISSKIGVVNEKVGVLNEKFTKTPKVIQETTRQVGVLEKQMGRMATIGGGLFMYNAFYTTWQGLKKLSSAAVEYSHNLNRMNLQGWDSVDIANAQKAAWDVALKYPSVGVNESMAMLSDMRYTFGTPQEAIKFLPKM